MPRGVYDRKPKGPKGKQHKGSESSSTGHRQPLAQEKPQELEQRLGVNKRPRQDRLPGTEGGIPELEQLGFEIAATRDIIEAAKGKEANLEAQALVEMRKNNVLTYKYEGVLLQRVPGEEKLKVQIKTAKPQHADTEGAGDGN